MAEVVDDFQCLLAIRDFDLRYTVIIVEELKLIVEDFQGILMGDGPVFEDRDFSWLVVIAYILV